VVTGNFFGLGHHREGELPPNGSSGHLPIPAYPATNWYTGPLPALTNKPSPTPGATPVPGTPWVVEHSWGEGLPLENYPHRDWPATQTTYVAATVKHNPVYFAPIQNRLPIVQNDSSYAGNVVSSVLETPWFALQTLALPALMLCDPPLKQVTTQRLGNNPVFLGHQSADGPIVPSPTPGVIRWEYPFLASNPNAPAGAPAATQPITPTPGIELRPEELPTTAPATEAAPAVTPGLK
jgi:hypothetical protein